MDIDASNATPVSDLRKVTSVEVNHYRNIVQPRREAALHAFRHDKQPYIIALLFDLYSHVYRIDGNQKAQLKL